MTARFRFPLALGGMLAAAAASTVLVTASAPKFYDDDPVRVERDSQSASGLQALEANLFVEITRGMIDRPAPPRGLRAANVNTIDEVPDSSWYTNRAGAMTLTPERIAIGPNETDGPADGVWTIVASKSDGITPGFTIADTTGERWFLKFDPPGYPGMATGTEVTVTKLMWALGYHVPENHIATLRRDQLVIGDGTTFTTPNGQRRPMRMEDVAALLARADRQGDGTYRVMASRRLPGQPVGRIRFAGTRPDDPNDVVRHEDRRELRGYGVFAAWLNHVDAKSINSLDVLIDDEDGSYVRHYLVDFGSTLGSGGIGPAEYWAGNEFLLEPRQAGRQMIGFGFSYPKWHTAPYYEARAIGRLPMHNADFNPELWRPRVANPAFLQARADDKFWAARKLMALETPLIRAAVAAGQFNDPAAEEFLVRALAERRDAIGRTYLTGINPIVEPALDRDGTLTFRNAAVDADFARAPGGYRAAWAAFDNATGDTRSIGESFGRTTSVGAPAPLPSRDGAFLKVDLSATDTDRGAWMTPVSAYFRLRGTSWQLVGVERPQ